MNGTCHGVVDGSFGRLKFERMDGVMQLATQCADSSTVDCLSHTHTHTDIHIAEYHQVFEHDSFTKASDTSSSEIMDHHSA